MAYYFDEESFGKLVKARRSGRTLTSVSAEAKISLSAFSRAESGNIPRWPVYLRLCEWLNVSPRDFIVEEGKTAKCGDCDTITSILRRESAFSSQFAGFLCLMIENAYEQFVEVDDFVSEEDLIKQMGG